MQKKSFLDQIKEEFLTPGGEDFHNWEKMAAFMVSKLGDTSIRDNSQSHYANVYYLEDQIDFAKAYNEVLKAVKEQGYQPARTETTGGANVLESIRKMAENPIHIVKEIKKAMPDARIGMLLRGRQGTFYAPIPEDKQRDLIDKFIKEGVTDFSVFDMLNDKTNYLPSMQHIIKKHIEQVKADVPESERVKLEICQSYITEPHEADGSVKKAQVWGDQRFADSYVETIKDIIASVPEEDRHLLNKNSFVLKNKDYAGLLNSDRLESFMNTTNATLEEAFNNKEIPFIPSVVIHSHGEKPEMTAKAFELKNVEYIDTGIGELSGGNAHGNITNVLKQICQHAGIEFEKLENTKVVQAIKNVEQVIQPINTVLAPAKAKGLPFDMVDKLRMAGGGIAAMDNIIKEPLDNGMFNNCVNKIIKKFVKDNPEYDERKGELKELLQHDFASLKAKTYEVIPLLWETGGRFHTVTPGAKILADASVMEMIDAGVITKEQFEKDVSDAVNIIANTLDITKDSKGRLKVVDAIDHIKNNDLGKVIPSLTEPYKNIIKGRFGENRGIELLELQDFRDAVVLHDFIKEGSKIDQYNVTEYIKKALRKETVDISDTYKLVQENPGIIDKLKDTVDLYASSAKKEKLLQELKVGKINENVEQYNKRTGYEQNVKELLAVHADSKDSKWTEEDIKILAIDPTAVKDIKSALEFEQGKKPSNVHKIKSREEVIVENVLKPVQPKLLIGLLKDSSYAIKNKKESAVMMVKDFYKSPDKEVWRRIENWMSEFPDDLKKVITDNKDKIIDKIDYRAYRKLMEAEPLFRELIQQKLDLPADKGSVLGSGHAKRPANLGTGL